MRAILLLMILGCFSRGISQPPNQFNYQAVARNTLGQNIPNAKINLRISILDGGTTGTSVYSETRQTTTNQMGLFTAAIGGPGAVATTGDFSTINWSTGKKFIQVEVDPLGGNNFTVLGNTEMLSVPYALYAVNSKPGTPGPANVLSIGTVTTAAPGTPAAASLTGTSPQQILNLTLPAGVPAIVDGWGLKGNAATDPALNFIGTVDNQPLRFKVNNIWAGEIHPTSSNTFIGLNAGQANTKGAFNTASGDHALFSNTEGIYNAAMGFNALRSNTTGGSNAAFGSGAMYSNISGLYNSAFGAAALYFNVSGTSNTANGASALYNNITGSNNTASGYNSLFGNTTGNSNTAFGAGGLQANKTGNSNTAVGLSALLTNNGDNNTANGVNALVFNTNGDNNTAMGNFSLYNNTNGNNNTAVGYSALLNNNTGNNNIAIGWNAGIALNGNTPTINNTISIGNDDLLNGFSNQAFIGNTSTMWIGGMVTWRTYSDARMKNNIKEDVQGLSFILKLRPVTYNISITAINSLTGNKASPDFQGKYDTEKTTYTGFLAQEVEAAANSVHYNFSGYSKPKNKNGLYSLSYEQFVVPLVKAVQEQQVMIINQQKQIELLEKRLAIVEARK